MKSAKNFRKNSRRNKNTRKINLKYKNKKIGGSPPKSQKSQEREELREYIKKMEAELEKSKSKIEELKSKNVKETEDLKIKYENARSEILKKMEEQLDQANETTPLINRSNTKNRKKTQPTSVLLKIKQSLSKFF